MLKDAHALQLNVQEQTLKTEDQFVEIPSFPPLGLTGAEGFSIMVWVKGNQWTGNRVVDKTSKDGATGYMLELVPTSVYNYATWRFCASHICLSGERLLSLGQWHHLAVSYHPDQRLSLYVDGVLDLEWHQRVAIEPNLLPLRIGKPADPSDQWRGRHGEGVFDGVIDDLSLWSAPLKPRLLSRLMFSRPGASQPNLIGYWGFNEGSGDIVHDTSIHQYHGRIFGQPHWIPAVSRPLSILSSSYQPLTVKSLQKMV